MQKVLLLQTDISPYSVCVFNEIATEYDLTVAYTESDKSKEDCRFTKNHLSSFHIGPLTFVKNILRLVKNYDVVIFPTNFHIPSYCILPFVCKKNKIISWDIGFRVSYEHPFDVHRKHGLLDYLNKIVLNKCDASIFYMERAKYFWRNSGVDFNKIFVAPNSTKVKDIKIVPEEKKSILFVGTLYKGKGVDKLLESYRDAISGNDLDNKLVIVGDGVERKSLEAFVLQNNLSDQVEFKGAVFDEEILASLFSQALLCVSPTQAGLSVPKSMGYGVPFVTRADAVTGGEICHITNNDNGLVYQEDKDLTTILKEAFVNPSKFIEMGMKARSYYMNNATPKHTAKGFLEAINYVCK